MCSGAVLHREEHGQVARRHHQPPCVLLDAHCAQAPGSDANGGGVLRLFSDPRFAPETQAKAGASPARRGADANQRAKPGTCFSSSLRGREAKRHREHDVPTAAGPAGGGSQPWEGKRLLEHVAGTNPRYIRCIKPNGNKQVRSRGSKLSGDARLGRWIPSKCSGNCGVPGCWNPSAFGEPETLSTCKSRH